MTKYALASGFLCSSSFLLGLLLETRMPHVSHAASSSNLPAHHPRVPQSSFSTYIDPKFHGHLHCPYAAKWLVDGPAKASRDLGLDSRGRKLQGGADRRRRRNQEDDAASTSTAAAMGRCDFTNAFSGQATCLEFRGAAWTEEIMMARCEEESGALELELDATKGCRDGMEDTALAGWCLKEGEGDGADERVEATAMTISSMADCDGNRMACQTFVGGRFVPDGVCGGDDGGGENDNVFDGETTDASASDAGGTTCAIAPGAIGAAHQAAYSSGYLRSGCPDTPARNSPYMWPLKWAADYESHSMPAYTDEVVFHAKGRTYYALDKNWKRSDTVYQKGVLRTIGQSPCSEEDIDPDFAEKGLLGCWKNQTDYMTTMLHLGNMMYFLSYRDNVTDALRPGETDPSKIDECISIDLAVIGNIRPDWFLDKRGDDTDVQYLGNQHVYYSDENRTSVPKLVKQWRKKDFASQYFVMSMMGNPPNRLENNATDNIPVEDTLHWPLILNIPGEGFGDDQLQVYRNHALLTDDDDDLFTLVQRYEAMGGVCGNARGGDDDASDIGPPVLEEEAYIPSDLEVDPNSWVSNEYTFSPVWQVPTQEMGDENDDDGGDDAASAAASSGKATTRVSDRLTVQSCHDTATNTIDLSFHFHDIAPSSTTALLPWMAIGYRSSDVCAMTPLEGGSTPLVLVATPPNESAPTVYKTELPPEAKSMSSEAFATMYANMVPLEDVEGDVVYGDVVLESALLADPTAAARASSPFGGEDDVVSLRYRQSLDEDSAPDAMYLMYAIGMSSELGIHETRGCFELVSFPVCMTDGEDAVQVEIDGNNSDGERENGEEGADASSSGMVTARAASALSSAVIAMAVFGVIV